jgi:hypothetical protein
MMRHQAEQLAIEHTEPAELPAVNATRRLRGPLGQLAEAGAEHAAIGGERSVPRVRVPRGHSCAGYRFRGT